MVRLRHLRRGQRTVHSVEELASEDRLGADPFQEVVVVVPRRHRLRSIADVALRLAHDAHRRQQAHDRLDHSVAQRTGQIAVDRIEVLLGVALVAAEQLVAAVAAEQRVYPVVPGELGAVVGRHRRGVSIGLVVDGGNQGNGAHHVVGRDIVFVVPRSEMPRGDARVLHFVVALGLEADRIRARGLPRDLTQHARNRGAVGAAAQEGSDRPFARRFPDAFAQRSEEVLLEVGQGPALVLGEAHFPVGARFALAVAPQQEGAGQQPVPVRVNGARPGHHVKVNVIVNGLPVDLGHAPRERADRVEGGPEHKRAADHAVAQRARAHAIDRQHGFADPAVQDGEGKGALERLSTPRPCRA